MYLADPSQLHLGGKDGAWGVHGAGEEEGKGPGLQGEEKSCCSKKNCDALSRYNATFILTNVAPQVLLQPHVHSHASPVTTCSITQF